MVMYYIDSCIFIYHLENSAEFGPRAAPYFRNLAAGKFCAVASSLVMQEVLAGIYKYESERALVVFGLLSEFPNLRWVEYDLQIAAEAAELAAEHGLRTPDAIHLRPRWRMVQRLCRARLSK